MTTAFIYLEDLENAAIECAKFAPWGPFEADTNQAICREKGHDIVDCSSAGPDSGNMDHECRRCGRYWSVALY